MGGSATTEAIGGVGVNDWSTDGAPTMGAGDNTSWLPFSTAIQEFKVETSQFDASVGHTTGATVSILTKGGSNSYHGALTYQAWQQILNAADWGIRQNYYRSIAAAEAAGNTAEANRIRATRITPSLHHNGFAGTIGGPILRDRLFYFVSMDGFVDRKLRRGSPNNTMPTLLNQAGDFTDLLATAQGARYQLYDPLSVRVDPARPGHFVRDPIVGNKIPANRLINPAYKTYMDFLPTPNNPPASASLEPLDNFVAAEPLNWWQYTLTNRIDYELSHKHRLFGRWTKSQLQEDSADWVYQKARKLMTTGLHRNVRNATLDWVFTPSSTIIVDTVVAVNDFEQWNSAWSTPQSTALNYKPSDVGLPAYMDQKAGEHHSLPVMSWSGYQGIGRPVGAFTHYQTVSAKSSVTNIRGRHTLRTGIDVRNHMRFGGNPGAVSGTFSFTNFYTRREDDTLTPTGALGHSWAAFMMGLPTTATVDTNDSYAQTSPYVGWFVSDNWRVTDKLTLNLGLRLDYEFGRLERYDRLIGNFDPTLNLPITDLAQAAYAASPIPELAASAFQVRGGSVYANTSGLGRRVGANESMWMPRIGFAYQINRRTVLRGGYGVSMDRQDALNTDPDQFGFSRVTNNPITNNFGVSWTSGNPAAGISPLTDPFPLRSDGTRFDAPAASGLGSMARAGLGWSFGAFETPQRARAQRTRLELQRDLGGSMMVSAAYGGLFADRVNITRPLDALPEQYWANGMTRNNALASNLNSNVPNPFYINNFSSLQTSHRLVYQAMSSLPFFTSPTIRKEQLLRPFPHMNGLNQLRTPDGEVKAHSLELNFQRRMTKGVMVQVNYTFLRQRDRDFYFNDFDALPSWRLSNVGTPRRMAFVGIFELPFGKTKPLLRGRIGNALLGGWQTAFTYEWQPGQYLTWGNVFFRGDLENIELDKDAQTLDRWFNTEGFERIPANAPAAFHRRVFPSRIGGVRADGLNRLDGNLQREFRIRERFVFQLKGDFINLMNRTQFAAPNIDPLSTNFGRVTANASSTKRFVLLQGRITF